ncbi:YkuS family protein [Bacillus sp. BHET2]|uniref:YkuS family protein n=1 Tax=Bacillus sp. BHET2 TaxID=2583818 RepID=UPI00110EDAB6|nr:YkuS family protein [Bacillus sp. BHET2]TMU84864.1 YkuS family protein [Bacillus sp. BHET2]
MRIGVEQSLQNVVQALREKGHDVVELKQESDANGCDCCIVTGMDTNVMGIQNVATQGPVIEASGLSADQICHEVENRFH